jgi:hypothetical protein
MSDITDKLRDKWEGITPRERRLVVLLGVAVPIVLTVFLGMKISEGLDEREARVKRMRRAVDVLVDLRSRPEAKADTDDALAEITSTPIVLETYVAKAAEKLTIPTPAVTPGQTQNREGFVTHSVRFDVRDLTVQQMKDLLEALETGSKRVVITALTINRKFRDEDKDKLDLKLEVTTYSRPADQAGSAGASGSAGTGSNT